MEIKGLGLWGQSTGLFCGRNYYGSSGSPLGGRCWLSTQHYYLLDSFLQGLITPHARQMLLSRPRQSCFWPDTLAP